MMDPRRKAAAATPASLNKRAAARTTAGRWSLLCEHAEPQPLMKLSPAERQAEAIAKARRTDTAHESAARMLLCRYGVLFRDVLDRESNAPKWRDLLGVLRRLEARGEIRGGRFISGFGGEQFALPQAVESLRLARNQSNTQEISVSAADPMNLAGIVVPGPRTPAVPGRHIRFKNGILVMTEEEMTRQANAQTSTPSNPDACPIEPIAPQPALRLF